jgi:hypothetical protein
MYNLIGSAVVGGRVHKHVLVVGDGVSSVGVANSVGVGLVDAALVLVHVDLATRLLGPDNRRQAVVSTLLVPFFSQFFLYKN